jgi:hypothetical protein
VKALLLLTLSLVLLNYCASCLMGGDPRYAVVVWIAGHPVAVGLAVGAGALLRHEWE